ncbi:Bug family tripartite tricarboxylate transporter substrate binding protein [Variovorax boronicumulans]|uniref:Bug family tripartite tricarboxylate transporter substrate binding protein n=1 Tax=Variovorax boronicumulans TaxID=436515 RepID=UPI001C57EE49
MLKKIHRRACLALAGLAGLVLAGSALAADPSRITIVVPYPPGGLADIVARLTGKVLAQNMGVPVIVENKPGANGVLGLQAIAHAVPDGATIGLVPASVLTVNPWLYKDMKVDTLKDVLPLTLAVTLPNVLVVNRDLPVKNLEELVAYLKKTPNVNFGSMGTGSSAHLNGEMLQRSTGVTLTHVPYKGSGAVMQDLMGGNIQMAFENLPLALPLIQSGKLRAIGVTSSTVSPQAPDIPPISAVVPGMVDQIWFGFIAPRGLPKDVATRLHDQLVRALQSDEVGVPIRERGANIAPSTPEAMQKVIVEERGHWQKLIAERNISVN